jgi:UDP-perosamine 4-acetyltransferase
MPLILLGAGGHAKVMLRLAETAGYKVIGVCDPHLAAQPQVEWRGVPLLGGDDALSSLDPASVELINGVGQLVSCRVRAVIYQTMLLKGFRFPSLVHSSAWVSPCVSLADGVQVMAGAIIQPDCEIGENSIINTSASVDHDCFVAENVHIAPGARLCGGVRVGTGAFIGSGAIVLQGVKVGEGAIVGAGVTLTRDLAPRSTRIGAASRIKSQLQQE